jgi:hypothetical protein
MQFQTLLLIAAAALPVFAAPLKNLNNAFGEGSDNPAGLIEGINIDW